MIKVSFIYKYFHPAFLNTAYPKNYNLYSFIKDKVS